MNNAFFISLMMLIPLVTAGLTPDSDGYLRDWLLLEPFELDEKASDHTEESESAFFDRELFPEQFMAKPKDGDRVMIGAKAATWKVGHSTESVIQFEEHENSMYLATVYVISDREVPDAVLSVGSDDSSCWRVNGAEVLRVFEGRAVEPDQNRSRSFTLRKGSNIIYAAVINGGGEVGLSARILDAEGKPIPSLILSLTP